MNPRGLIGIALGFAIGFGCRGFGIPVPAPPVLLGAVLVVAMTVGSLLAERYLERRRQLAPDASDALQRAGRKA